LEYLVLHFVKGSCVWKLCAGVFSPAEHGCDMGFRGPLLLLVSFILAFVGLAGEAGSAFPPGG